MGVTEKKKKKGEREKQYSAFRANEPAQSPDKLHILWALLPLVIPRMPEITTRDLSQSSLSISTAETADTF